MLKSKFALKRWTKEFMTEIIKAMNCAESANEKTLLILLWPCKKRNKWTIESKAIPAQVKSLIAAGCVPKGRTQQPLPALRKSVYLRQVPPKQCKYFSFFPLSFPEQKPIMLVKIHPSCPGTSLPKQFTVGEQLPCYLLVSSTSHRDCDNVNIDIKIAMQYDTKWWRKLHIDNNNIHITVILGKR